MRLVLQLLPEGAEVVLYEREADVVTCVMQAQGSSSLEHCLPDKGVLRMLKGSWARLAVPTGRAAKVAEVRQVMMQEER